jgi:hypothetical protein
MQGHDLMLHLRAGEVIETVETKAREATVQPDTTVTILSQDRTLGVEGGEHSIEQDGEYIRFRPKQPGIYWLTLEAKNKGFFNKLFSAFHQD